MDINFVVVADLTCQVGDIAYKDGAIVSKNCEEVCTCTAGHVNCQSTCTEEKVIMAPSSACPQPLLVASENTCCKTWKCFPEGLLALPVRSRRLPAVDQNIAMNASPTATNSSCCFFSSLSGSATRFIQLGFSQSTSSRKVTCDLHSELYFHFWFNDLCLPLT